MVFVANAPGPPELSHSSSACSCLEDFGFHCPSLPATADVPVSMTSSATIARKLGFSVVGVMHWSAGAQVFREAEGRVSTNVMVRDLDVADTTVFFLPGKTAENQSKDGHTSQTSCEPRITNIPNHFVRRWSGAVVPQSASPFQERLSKSPRTGTSENHAPPPHPSQLRSNCRRND